MNRWLLSLLTLILLVGVRAEARPALDDNVEARSCDAGMTEERREVFDRFQRRLAGADSVDDARALAHRRVEQVDSVLRRAEVLVPGDEGLAQGRTDLDSLALSIDAAQTPSEVATAFGSLDAQASGRCDYTTGEIIAIVLGFILGIIPGIILLILLC